MAGASAYQAGGVTIAPFASWLSGNERLVAWRDAQPIMLSTLRQQVSALCQQLQQRSEMRWALCFDDSYLFCVALLACLHAGKTPVMPGHARPALLREQRRSFDALLSDSLIAMGKPALRIGKRAGRSAAPLPAVEDSAHLVLFTSGSTGQPREIIKPLAGLLREAQWLATLWGDQLANSQIIASVSHQHLYGLTFRILLPLALRLPFDARQILYAEQLSVRPPSPKTVFISSPAFLRRLDQALQVPACALVISAAGALSTAESARAAAWCGCPVGEIYGSTETGVIAWRLGAGVWQPFTGVTLTPQPQDRWQIHSPLIAGEGTLMLDDRLAFHAEQGFDIVGRHDRVVKIEDKRISLSEVERRLMALPGIVDAATLVISRHGRRAVGVVLVAADLPDADQLPLLKRQWKQALQPWLEPLAVPRYWRCVTSIPHNSQSKRDWQRIEELFDAAD